MDEEKWGQKAGLSDRDGAGSRRAVKDDTEASLLAASRRRAKSSDEKEDSRYSQGESLETHCRSTLVEASFITLGSGQVQTVTRACGTLPLPPPSEAAARPAPSCSPFCRRSHLQHPRLYCPTRTLAVEAVEG